jgi:epsilon-lactone hydrolase
MIGFGLDGMRRVACLGFCVVALAPSVGLAQAGQGDALQVPAKSVPVPGTVSPQLAKIVGAPLRNGWDVLPKTGEEWVPIVQRRR